MIQHSHPSSAGHDHDPKMNDLAWVFCRRRRTHTQHCLNHLVRISAGTAALANGLRARPSCASGIADLPGYASNTGIRRARLLHDDIVFVDLSLLPSDPSPPLYIFMPTRPTRLRARRASAHLYKEASFLGPSHGVCTSMVHLLQRSCHKSRGIYRGR
ncbi:hypothetical protein BV25DRAFT_808319 [Artomyces pyxidatus]|uniref:Uncharacterized protein n=1 Tax=Artomyces pyxidatus TaxID=48021 RepID=A0ACB8SZR9_9AGAM|nr:hypothetical protein BV25DRAFT_808319 [Artomyces pyxidatus]